MKLKNPFRKNDAEQKTIFRITSDGTEWSWHVDEEISIIELVKILAQSELEIIDKLSGDKK